MAILHVVATTEVTTGREGSSITSSPEEGGMNDGR
jgi:hypothetical protein